MAGFSRFHSVSLQAVVSFKTEVSYIWAHYHFVFITSILKNKKWETKIKTQN